MPVGLEVAVDGIRGVRVAQPSVACVVPHVPLGQAPVRDERGDVAPDDDALLELGDLSGGA